MNKKQRLAIFQLECAFQECKRAGLVFVGVDDALLVTVGGAQLQEECEQSSTVEVVREREERDPDSVAVINTYSTYQDSGGA